MTSSDVVEGPYPGLRPYLERDSWRFFGRERERDLIVANLRAWPITILYGPSGVGKSSVLNAGVVPMLRELSQRRGEGSQGRALVSTFNRWDTPNPWEAVVQGAETAAGLTPAKRVLNVRPRLPVTLGSLADQVSSTLFLVMDQLEELFVYETSRESLLSFASRISDTIEEPGNKAKFLLSIREDGLAALDQLRSAIPNLFANTFRLDYLTAQDARSAIVEPLKVAARNERYSGPTGVEPDLVEAVLKQVEVGRVTTGGGGHSPALLDPVDPDARVETAYLQLVLERLCAAESALDSKELRKATFDRLGGAQSIVRTHLDETMKVLSDEDQDVAAKVFHQLVTPSGSKIAHTVSDLSKYTDIPESRLQKLADQLSGDPRILRVVASKDASGPPKLEIYHDALAPAILDWRARRLGRGLKWTTEVDGVLLTWLNQTKRMEEAHRLVGSRLGGISTAVTMSAVLVLCVAMALRSLTSGTAGLVSSDALMGGAALIVALQSLLGFSRLAEKHRSVASRYSNLTRQIAELLALRPELRPDDAKGQLERLQSAIDAVVNDSPLISWGRWQRSLLGEGEGGDVTSG